jgi:HK97 family phage major capsid protein
MDRIPLYLVALITAIAATPLNIFDVHARNIGIGTAEPWRKKSSGLLTPIVSLFARALACLWPHRQQIAVAVAVLCLMVFTSHAHAGTGVSLIVVGHLAQLETDLKAKSAAAKELLEKTMRACADHVVAAATATTPEVKGRVMTAEEKAAVQTILDEAKGIKARIDGATNDAAMMAEINRLTAGLTNTPANDRLAQRVLKSLGQQFVENPAYQAFIKSQAHRSDHAWASPAVEGEWGPLQATTLSEAAGSGGPLVLPDYQPGVLPLLFKRLVVADLIAPGTTESNLISYMKETTFTNAAATVAEGGPKPESTLVFAAATSAVQKIAHWIPVTEEMLEDFAQTKSIIDARLRLGLDLVEEDQLLNGDGTPPNLRGLMNLAGLTAAQARGADTNADAIFKQMTTIATTVFVMPDGFVINPANWMTIQLTKNAAGNYLGNGPWAPASPPTLWGIPGAVTPSIVANTAFVGAFRSCAQVFRRGGVRVESSNSHASFFTSNLVAVRAEERLALAAYRDAAFGKVTGLN